MFAALGRRAACKWSVLVSFGVLFDVVLGMSLLSRCLGVSFHSVCREVLIALPWSLYRPLSITPAKSQPISGSSFFFSLSLLLISIIPPSFLLLLLLPLLNFSTIFPFSLSFCLTPDRFCVENGRPRNAQKSRSQLAALFPELSAHINGTGAGRASCPVLSAFLLHSAPV
jgi:hypothetical protein